MADSVAQVKDASDKTEEIQGQVMTNLERIRPQRKKCCRDGRSFCKFRRGHGNDELVQRKYFRTEEKYRSFQELIKFFQHSAFCRVFLL